MSFAAAWEAACDVEGWLTEAQARRLFAAAGAVPRRRADRRDRLVPRSVGDRPRPRRAAGRRGRVHRPARRLGPRARRRSRREPALGEADLAAFRRNLERAGVSDRVRHVRDFSTVALRAFDGPVDLLFVDGAHRFGPARADLVRWGARVARRRADARPRRVLVDRRDARAADDDRPAAVVAVRGREGSLAAYVRSSPAGRAQPGLRELRELPWFAANLVRKGLIAAGVRDGPWPH